MEAACPPQVIQPIFSNKKKQVFSTVIQVCFGSTVHWVGLLWILPLQSFNTTAQLTFNPSILSIVICLFSYMQVPSFVFTILWASVNYDLIFENQLGNTRNSGKLFNVHKISS